MLFECEQPFVGEALRDDLKRAARETKFSVEYLRHLTANIC